MSIKLKISPSLKKAKATPKKKPKSKAQKDFDFMWEMVQKAQKKNKKLETDIDALRKVYHQQIKPAELATAPSMVNLCERLMDFFSRKSLPHWQRDELNEWIGELLDHLKVLSVDDFSRLSQQYKQCIIDFYEYDEEELQEIQNKIDETIEAFNNQNNKSDEQGNDENEDSFSGFDFNNDNFQEAGFDESDPSVFTENDFFSKFFGGQSSSSNDGKKEPSQLINEKWIRTIFKKTASALHPDKEQDPQQRERKQTLMAKLLNARDDNDVFTMLELHNEYVDAKDLDLAKTDVESLVELLRQQYQRLEIQRHEFIYANPENAMLHERLYEKSKKKQKETIEHHLNVINSQIEQNNHLTSRLKNMKVLKQAIEARFENDYDEEFEDDMLRAFFS